MNRATFTFICLLGFFSAFGQSQLENSYFAAWEDLPSTTAPAGIYQKPVGSIWATSNEASMIFLATPSVLKTNDSYIGEYAALIQTVALSTTKGSGTLFTGKFQLDVAVPLNSTKFGVPFTDRPYYLTGYYKYLPVANDSCRIASYLTRWNVNKRDTIAFATISRQQSMQVVSSYTQFNIAYDYRSELTPDSITIVFASSADGANFNAAIGTKLYIDEIGLSYFPLATEVFETKKEFNLFPNPANDYLNVENSGNCKGVEIKLFNSAGSVILKQNLKSPTETISLTSLQEGVYFYTIFKSDGTFESGKILKY